MIPRFFVGLVILLLALPAVAGGSWIDPYRDSYEAGETVTMRGGVSAGQLGWIEDGPFHAYLRVDPETVANDPTHPERWPSIHESDLYLGELSVSPAGRSGVEVSISFPLPDDLPDGEYWVVYCNDPCTTGLGDLIGGVVYVGITAEDIHGPNEHQQEPSAVAGGSVVDAVTDAFEPIPTEARLSSAEFTSESAEMNVSWVWVGLAALILILIGTVTYNRGRQN